eukprot:3694779-Rhodomonas_salina.1
MEPGGGTAQSKAVPPGLCNSAAYKWMICHLNGYGQHAYAPFPEKCNALSTASVVTFTRAIGITGC